jgi:hypothetical protein
MQAKQAYGSDRGGGNEIDPQEGPQAPRAGLFAPAIPQLFIEAITGSSTRPSRFLFAYGELPVIGELHSEPDSSELRLLVVVGRLPYSVESRDQREKMLDIIRAFPTELGESLIIAPDQSICVNTAAPMPADPTPARLLSEMVVRLFRLDPVLRSLADILPDLAPALGASPFADKGNPRAAPMR